MMTHVCRGNLIFLTSNCGVLERVTELKFFFPALFLDFPLVLTHQSFTITPGSKLAHLPTVSLPVIAFLVVPTLRAANAPGRAGCLRRAGWLWQAVAPSLLCVLYLQRAAGGHDLLLEERQAVLWTPLRRQREAAVRRLRWGETCLESFFQRTEALFKSPNPTCTCALCLQLIFCNEYTQAEGHNWHLKHFCCFDCDCILAGETYVMEKDKPVCTPCYMKSYAVVGVLPQSLLAEKGNIPNSYVLSHCRNAHPARIQWTPRLRGSPTVTTTGTLSPSASSAPAAPSAWSVSASWPCRASSSAQWSAKRKSCLRWFGSQDHMWNQDRSNIRESTTNTAGGGSWFLYQEPVQSLCKTSRLSLTPAEPHWIDLEWSLILLAF